MALGKARVHVVEVVPDADLWGKEAGALSIAKSFLPVAKRLKLYRTADGRIGCQLDVSVSAAERKRLDQAYDAIMNAVGERRGRSRGVKKTIE